MSLHPDPAVRTRREFLVALAASAAGAALTAGGTPILAQPRPTVDPTKAITIYKDPNCGCCTEWVKHLKQAGFQTTVRDMTDMNTVKRSFGVPVALESCHTARIGRYTIEGHVPADLISRLVKENVATARGLAVPGMPVGSPGMEMGNQKDRYDVILFDATGKTRVYASR